MKYLKRFWWLLVLVVALFVVWLDIFILFRRGRIVPNRVPRYQVIKGHWLPKLLGSGATTIRDRVLLRSGLIPSAKGLAHEYYHVTHTKWFTYLVSKITGSSYAATEESNADIWAELHWRDFERDAAIVSQALG